MDGGSSSHAVSHHKVRVSSSPCLRACGRRLASVEDIMGGKKLMRTSLSVFTEFQLASSSKWLRSRLVSETFNC